MLLLLIQKQYPLDEVMLKELYNIWKHMPEYWQKLTDLQHRTNRPMKKFRTDPEFGNLGNILNLEKYWAKQQTIKNEYEQQNLFT